MNTKLRTALLLSRRVAPGTRERGWGRIIFVSSVATFTGGVVGSHRTASKAALMGLMHVRAGPLVPHGVLVNTIAPALTKAAPRLRGVRTRSGSSRSILIGRLGSPKEVASVVVKLVEDRFIAAQAFSADSGMYHR